MKWFFLDPDNRRDPPKTGLYCCRCMKPLDMRHPITLRWTIHPENPWVRLDPTGDQLMGTDCWKQVQKNPIQEANK